ncbi:MAG: GntR family transcriptional regulator, partial [Rhizobium sp.]|nr:GntR family transcriptional regulator [Rhizobium sp.]
MIEDDLSPHSDKRAASNVIRSLERQIVSGDLADGAHLPSERELMEIYGVSRTVVREAVTTLASRGLLEARPRYRPIARRPGYDTALKAVEGAIGHLLTESDGIKNLFNSRIFLEMSLVRHAALHAKRADIEALKQALDANEAAIGQSEL